MSYLSQIKSAPYTLIVGDQAKTWTEEASDKLAQIERAGGWNAAQASGLLDLLSASAPTAEKVGPVGIIPIRGPIGKGLSKVDTLLGAVDLNQVETDLERFAADPSVKTILLDFNSPGGTVAGVPEVAQRVREINQAKKVVAFGNAASAAYWIGSQASEFLTTASAPAIGSVGVFVPHLDRSGELKAKGISVEVIKSGKYKGQIPGLPLSDDARAAIQAEVIELHNEFKADVLAVRSRINPDDLEGQTFTGKRAAARGFVTGLVRNRAEVLARLGATEPKAGKPTASPSSTAFAAVEMPEPTEGGETETEVETETETETETPEVPLSDRQTALYSALEKVVETFGKFDQGDGPNGSHYMPESPFAARGIVCANCPFYVGGGGCELVDGAIAEAGICKLWIIPEGKLIAQDKPTEEPAKEPAEEPAPSTEPEASTAPLAAVVTSVEVPTYVREAAARGLEWNREGKAGDGVTDKTLAEAREMAAGRVSVDKLRRMAPWFSRHRGDLAAPANNPDNKDFPGAGAVAWALWGGPTSGDVMRAAEWAETKVRIVESEEARAAASKVEAV